MWSRGRGWARRTDLITYSTLEQDSTLFEHDALVRPMSDVGRSSWCRGLASVGAHPQLAPGSSRGRRDPPETLF
jgi:hypothetical protein